MCPFEFSGYVSEIRKKDWKICCPFSLEVDQTESEEQTSFLPPLEVPKFRWWHCQNCLNKVAARAAAKDYGKLFNSCGTKCGSNSNCSHVASAAMLLPGFQQAPKPVLGGKTSVVANTSTKPSNDNHLLLCSDKKQKKVEVVHGTIIGTLQSILFLLYTSWRLVHFLCFLQGMTLVQKKILTRKSSN